MGRPVKVILDTDPGVDDAIAILMALAWPELELVGITTVGGNVHLARGTRNALALLEYAGRQTVPVARGAARPCRGRFPYAYAFHGPGGLSRRLSQPRMHSVDIGAAEFMAAKLGGDPGQITLVALGPLTNLACLLKRHPGALDLAGSLVVMGGAADGSGNVTSHAEFNFYSDPVAAHAVLSSGVPLTLVDLGAGRQVSLARGVGDRLKARSPLGRLVAQLLCNWFRQDPRRQRFEFYDPLAFAAALSPDLITTRPMELAVETSDPTRLGETRVVAAGGPVAVTQKVDVRRFFALLEDLFQLSYL